MVVVEASYARAVDDEERLINGWEIWFIRAVRSALPFPWSLWDRQKRRPQLTELNSN